MYMYLYMSVSMYNTRCTRTHGPNDANTMK